MPKQVDHEQRRREIADAVGRIAVTRGLSGVSFREVAAEAGVSVALVQHYFGTKENLLVRTVNLQSQTVAGRIQERVARLGGQARPLEVVRAIAGAFLPVEEPSRAAMLHYLTFGGAALTDPALRSADAFRNAFVLTDLLAEQLAAGQVAGEVRRDIDPADASRGILALLLGLSFTVLLDGATARQAEATLEQHLALLSGDSPGDGTR